MHFKFILILVTGSLAFDYIMNFPGRFGDHILPDKIHILNVSFLVNKIKQEKGGTAANIAYNLALLGERPAILAAAGNDFAEYKRFLNENGVDTSMIQIIKAEPTASAYIITDKDDNQITGFYPGAMGYARKLKISNDKFQIAIKNLKLRGNDLLVVISPNDPRAMMNYVRECQELGIDYLFDPGMQLPRLSAADVGLGVVGAKIVVGNDYEIALLNSKFKIQNSKDTSPKARLVLPSAKVKLKIKNYQIRVITLGSEGSRIEKWNQSGRKIEEIKVKAAKPKNVSDPTGAGDAYRAGFLAGFIRGLSLETCAKMGSIAAVYTVEKYGTTTHKFTKRQFCKRFEDNYGEKLEL